jgi:hypothetical protein
MRVKGTTAVAAAVFLITACGAPAAEQRRAEPTSDTSRPSAQGVDPTHVLFGCMVGDGAVYSNIETDSVSGVQIMLWQAGDGVDGATAKSTGELAPSVPIASVRLTGRDSVFLDMPREASSPDTGTFAGRVTCDSLSGRHQASRTSPAHEVSYLRRR